MKAFRHLGPAIHLEGYGEHFEYEYIIKPCKNLIDNICINLITFDKIRRQHLYLKETV